MSGRRLFWIVAALLVVALGLQLLRAERRWRASRIVATIERDTTRLAASGQTPRARIDHHRKLLRQAEELSPALVDAKVVRGWQYLLAGRPEAAIRVLEEARELEPRSEVYANLMQAYLMMDEHEAAQEAYETALALDPSLRKRLQAVMTSLR